MDASQYLRRRIASCSQTIGRNQCVSASVRTDILRHASNTVTNATAAPTVCCSRGGVNSTTTIVPIPGAACVCQDIALRYTTPYMTLPAAPMLYESPSYVPDCKVIPYVGTRAQHTEAVRLRACADCTPPPKDGSYCFTRAMSSVMSIANNPDFNIGASAFTIEWFQYMVPTTAAPTTRRNYVFSIGSPNAPAYSRIGFSIERDPPIANGAYQVYLHAPNNKSYYFGKFGDGGGSLATIENNWVHFAVCGYGGNGQIRLFVNGSAFGPPIDTNVENAPYVTAGNVGTYNFTNTDYTTYPLLTIGNTNSATEVNTFEGCITNFHWVHGTALYDVNATFTPPTKRLVSIVGSRFLGIGYEFYIMDESRTPPTSGNIGLTNVSVTGNTPFVSVP